MQTRCKQKPDPADNAGSQAFILNMTNKKTEHTEDREQEPDPDSVAAGNGEAAGGEAADTRAAPEAAEQAEAEAEAEAPEVADFSEEAGKADESEESELDKARREAADMKSRYLRSVADLENYRKRMAREKQETIRSASADLIESLLPVLDNLKLGLQAAENHPEAKDVTTGFRMVEEQLRKTLNEHGLVEIRPDGEKFDPNEHECISHQSSPDVEEDKVIQTVRAGYRLNDRLIRPANVIVSSGPETGDTDNESGAAQNAESGETSEENSNHA